METNRDILKTLNGEQVCELINDMRDWIKDCQWEDVEDWMVDSMSDEELIRGIERHYDGGLIEFVSAGQY